jgi:hypothetical protein
MTTRTFSLAALALCAFGAVASAQPKQPGAIQFKQIGGGGLNDQFLASAVSRWTGQLALELESAKNELARSNLNAFVRAGITQRMDRVIEECAQLDAVVRRNAPRQQVSAAFAELERDVDVLHTALLQNPAALQIAIGPLSRAADAVQQLSRVLGGIGGGGGGGGGPIGDPTAQARRLTRMVEAAEDAGDELRNAVADQIGGPDRALERALGHFVRECRLFGRRLRAGESADLLHRTYEGMGVHWAEALDGLARVRNPPEDVFQRAQKVDQLHRRFGAALGRPPFPGGANPGLPNAKRVAFAVGADAGAQPRVTVFADERGTVAHNFFAYDVQFDGGVRVDMADLNGDGLPELVVAPGPHRGAALPVRVFGGRDMSLLIEFVPFANYTGGVQTAALNLTRDGKALVAATTDTTGQIKVFDLATGKVTDDFFGHDPKRVTGGLRLAWGDVNGDRTADLITVTGPSNSTTTVRVFDGKNRDVLAEFVAVDAKYRAGAFVTAADLDGNGRANPVIGLDAGTLPLVRVFDEKGRAVSEWMAYDRTYKGGVRVAVSDRNRVVVAPGGGLRNSPVRVFDAARPNVQPGEFSPFPGHSGGLHVGGR